MSPHPSLPVGPIVVGASHRSSALALRERLLIEDAALPQFLARLAAAGIAQAVTLSTSERVEVFALHEAPEQAAAAITRVLTEQAGLKSEEVAGQLYVLQGEEAVRHIFAVAAALDSLILGEPQILEQIGAGRTLARERGMLGPELDALLEAAVTAAERVRAETGLGARPASIAAAAVQIARDIHGDLSRCTGLVLGPGDMGELLAEQLLDAGLGRLVLTGRSATRLEQASRRLKCQVIPLDTLEEALAEADIVVTSLGVSSHLITADMVEAALRRRRRQPVFLIDAAIPGDIDLAAADADGAFLFDLGDLERVIMESQADREATARAAWDIVEAEAATYLQARGRRAAGPVIEALRTRFHSLRSEALAVAGSDAEAATGALVEQLLRELAGALERISTAGKGERAAAEAWLRRLFGLAGRGAGRTEGDEGHQS
jgi:glutamyl-tRNA reductase